MLKLSTYLAAKELTISNLVLQYYQQLGMTEEELVLYLQLTSYDQQGNHFPEVSEIAQRMGKDAELIFQLIESLIAKNIITLESSRDQETGRMNDAYNLFPLYEKLERLLKQTEKQVKETEETQALRLLYQQFEKEFGRPLSPIEIETIAAWIEQDHYNSELIRLALKEAVLNQAYNLRYIDRILLSWERKNIRTKEEVYKEQQQHKRELLAKEVVNEEQKPIAKVPLFNWLNQAENEKGE